MPPKKKHLTPEERKERKKEAKLRKAEEKKQLQRDNLGREVKYGQLTVKKYEKDWREMLVRIAVPRMRQELEFSWHHFERAVDCKDFTISLLLDQIREAEEQYMHNFKTHLDNMEDLMWLFHDRLVELKKDYQEHVLQIEKRIDNELQEIKDVTNDNEEYLKTMLYKLELERKEHNRLKKGEYFSRLDEVDAKNQLLLQKLKATLETSFQNMFEDMKRFTKTYTKKIKDRKKEHDGLKQADDDIQELISLQFLRMKKLYETIRRLKQNYIDLKQTDGCRLLDLQAERQYFSNSFLALKAKLDIDVQEDFKKLVRVSESSGRAFDFLEALNKKGEMILSLAAICRKLETKKEKILSFPLGVVVLNSDTEQDLQEEVDRPRPEMELFWQRLGQAFGVHYALTKEKKFLKEENEILVDHHNDYCDRLQCPSPKPRRYIGVPSLDVTHKILKFRQKRVQRHIDHLLKR